MPNKELESKVITIGGFPQVIPPEFTPEAVYNEEGIGENVQDRIKYWNQRYSGDVGFSTTDKFESPEQELASLENYYMQTVALSD